MKLRSRVIGLLTLGVLTSFMSARPSYASTFPTPTVANFGTVQVGFSSQPMTITGTNSTVAVIATKIEGCTNSATGLSDSLDPNFPGVIQDLCLTQPGALAPADFAITQNNYLGVSAARSLQIVFTPSAPGFRWAVLRIRNIAPLEGYDANDFVLLKGNRTDISSVSPNQTPVTTGDPLKGTVKLDGPAADTGEAVDITATTIWPTAVNRPQFASVDPGTVTMFSGNPALAQFDIKTDVNPVLYPVGIKLTAADEATGTTKSDSTLVVLPPSIGAFGADADSRVKAIVNEFVTRAGGSTTEARVMITNVRQMTIPEAQNDDYLTAADHYLVAYNIIAHPGSESADLGSVGGNVLLAYVLTFGYDTVKFDAAVIAPIDPVLSQQILAFLGKLAGNGMPASPFSPLVTLEAVQGINDAWLPELKKALEPAMGSINLLQNDVNGSSLDQGNKNALQNTLNQVQSDLNGSSPLPRPRHARIAAIGPPNISGAIRDLMVFIQQVNQLMAQGLILTQGPGWIAQAQAIIESLGGTATATAPADHVPPTCVLSAVIPGPPPQTAISVQDTGSGLAEVQVVASANASVSVPTFSMGTTRPVIVMATRIDSSKAASLTLRLVDVAGNVAVCSQNVSLQPNGALLTIMGGGSQATIKAGDCVTLQLKVRYQGTAQYVDVTQDPNTSFMTVPATGHFSAKNVWCATAADANKSVTIYGQYRDPITGVSSTSPVSVVVHPG